MLLTSVHSTGTRLCPARTEAAELQGHGVSGAVAGASWEPLPWLLGTSKRADGGDALRTRKGCFPMAGWRVMVFEKVRQSPEAEQPCLKGAGFVVCSGMPEALSLCHYLAWPLRAALVGRKLGKHIGITAGASASGSFHAAGIQCPCK